jgi:hypothetical protein
VSAGEPTVGSRAVIIQSNYIPWKGYFDLLAHADTVVLFDSVQSTKNDWRNRNVIKSQGGKSWLTVPVNHSNTLRVREVTVASPMWHQKHLRTIKQAYARAPHAAEVFPLLDDWYARAGALRTLSDVNRVFLSGICRYLGIGCRVLEVQDLMADEEHDRLQPTERLVQVCRRIQADTYLSGPAARSYLDTARFAEAGVAVEWFDYAGYPEYPQLHGPYEPAVSILDLLLMNGPASPGFALRGEVAIHVRGGDNE